jgi:hypothetical protein
MDRRWSYVTIRDGAALMHGSDMSRSRGSENNPFRVLSSGVDSLRRFCAGGGCPSRAWHVAISYQPCCPRPRRDGRRSLTAPQLSAHVIVENCANE